MRASTSIRVSRDARGRSVVDSLRCEAPLLVRVDGGSEELTLLLVGGAAGPVGGDDLGFELDIDDGASVVVRSIAATLAQPGPTGDTSRAISRVRVGSGASLDWCTEPLISVRGSDHHVRFELEVAADARARVTESFRLGRSHEPSGTLSVRQRISRAGAVMLDHESRMGDGAFASSGANGRWRWWTSTVVVGPDAPVETSSSVSDDHVSGGFAVADGLWIGVTGAMTSLT